jgi:hypothetical protein
MQHSLAIWCLTFYVCPEPEDTRHIDWSWSRFGDLRSIRWMTHEARPENLPQAIDDIAFTPEFTSAVTATNRVGRAESGKE